MAAFELDRGIEQSKINAHFHTIYHEQGRENGSVFQALSDDALSVFSTETVRSMAMVVQCSCSCFSLLKNSDTRNQ